MPINAGEITCKAIGMAVDVADPVAERDVSIEDSGEAGDLVCRKPFPSQPIMFWGKDGEKKYRASYFERYGDQVWYQGDLVQMSTDTGGIRMLGRSSVTLLLCKSICYFS